MRLQIRELLEGQPSLTLALGRDGQLHRSDMFIVHEPNQNRLKPHRGGMVASGAVHAAPMELERILGCAVTINRSLLRSWRWIGQGRKAASERPNPASAVDGGTASLANSRRPWPAATDLQR
jgi:hypothetical protein